MRSLLHAALSRDAIGLAIAALCVLAGWALAAASPLGWLLVVAGAVLAAGAVRHCLAVASVERTFPPPGRLVDIGGFRLHVRADGETRGGKPAVVWFGGGHASGASMAHLHRAVMAHTRSILIDRAGSGWSDIGPFPRGTAREAEEAIAALERAGEKGPFVFVGHSFGGLLAANIARRRPDLAASVVLLDPTPPDGIAYNPRPDLQARIGRAALVTGVLRLFGVHDSPAERQLRANPELVAFEKRIDELLGAEGRADRALAVRARAHLASASIFRELAPQGLAACGWQTVVYDGDLEDLPVLVVAPVHSLDLSAWPELAGVPEGEGRRMERFYRVQHARWLAVSSRTQWIAAPAGTGHNFIYEAPEFVAELVRGRVESGA